MSNVDWDFWLDMQTVKIWQAVALSMDIDPDKFIEKRTAEGFDGYRTTKEKGDFDKRCEMLTKKVFTNENLRSTKGVRPKGINQPKNPNAEIYLKGFPEWALRKNWDIPKELKTLVDPENSPKDAEPEETELDSILSASDFDLATKAEIITMFDKLTSDKWKEIFKRKARNDLKELEEKGGFNPFKVGEWLVKKGHYKREQVERRLANNLPPRSRYKKDLITDY
jgi:hypothetical protein